MNGPVDTTEPSSYSFICTCTAALPYPHPRIDVDIALINEDMVAQLIRVCHLQVVCVCVLFIYMLLRRKNNILFLKNNILFLKNFEEIKNATLSITNKDMHVFPGSPKDIDCIYSIM